MDPKNYHDPDELREAGVHLTPYGLPAYPKASETAKLRKQILSGIPMPSGDIVLHGDEMASTLASGWLDPDALIPQFRSPRYKSTRAGMAATVSGLMPVTALQTNPFNPRPNSKLEIPVIDAGGRVAMPWAPTDRRPDPLNAARMLVDIPDRDELNARILESERHVVAEQAGLADLVRREGVEEDLLAIVVRFATPGLAHPLGVVTVDGNSRVAIARAAYRAWISRHRDDILAVVRSAKPRLALARTLDRLRDGLFPLEHDDPVALRHLHKAIIAAVSGVGTSRLVQDELYAVANLFVVPVTMIIAFEPADPASTVLDAADLMMRNVHHPARAPKVWDPAAGHAEIRDEVVAKLYNTGWLTIGEALYLGPRYEEAAHVHGLPSEPDRRAIEAVNLVNGDHDIGREGRALISEAIGTPRPGRALRAQIITAILSEQVRTASAQARKAFETAMHDLLDTKRYGSVAHTPPDSPDTPEEMLAAAEEHRDAGYDVDSSHAIMELALKGAIALAAQGHLTRIYAATTGETPRPYQIIDNMLDDETGFGMRMLAEAVRAWRSDQPLPEYDVQKRRPIKGAAAMRPATLAAMFPNPDTSVVPTDSATDLLDRMHRVLIDRFQPILDELLALPEVRREGAPSDAVEEVLNILVPARQKLELQAAKFEEFHETSAADATPAGAAETADEAL